MIALSRMHWPGKLIELLKNLLLMWITHWPGHIARLFGEDSQLWPVNMLSSIDHKQQVGACAVCYIET